MIRWFFLFLLFVISLNAQTIMSNSKRGILVAEEKAVNSFNLNSNEIDSILVSAEIRDMQINSITASGVTLIDSIEQLSNSNRWFTNLGSWSTSGNMSATRQSDSSVTLSNIGTELNTNLNFSDFAYNNIVVNGDMSSSTNWTLSGAGAVISGGGLTLNPTLSTAPYAWNTLSSSASLNDVFVLTYTISSSSISSDLYLYRTSGFRNALNATSLIIPKTVGTHRYIFLADGAGARNLIALRVVNGTGSIILDDVSVKKLIAPTGWAYTSTTVTSTTYCISETNGVRYVSDGAFVSLAKNIGTVAGDTVEYKIVISENTGSGLYLLNTSGSTVATLNSAGVFTGTFVNTGNVVSIKRVGATNTVLSFASFKKKTANNKFNLTQITEPNKKYSLDFKVKYNSISSAELNPNVNFDITYTDLLSGWDFTNGWTNGIPGTTSIVDNNTMTTTGYGGIYKGISVSLNDVIKLDFVGTTSASQFRITTTAGSPNLLPTTTGSINFSDVVLWSNPNPNFFLNNQTAGTLDVSSMIIRKLIAPPGWITSKFTATDYVYRNSNGLQFKEGTGTTYIELNLTANKYYRLIGNIYSRTSGELNLFTNGVEYPFRTTAGLDTIDVFCESGRIRLQVDNNSDLVLSSLSIKEYIPGKKLYFNYGAVSDSMSLMGLTQNFSKEFWGQGSNTIKLSNSINAISNVKNISLQEITTKKIVTRGDTTKVYFAPNTSSVGNKTANITLNGTKVIDFAYSVEYPDSLLFADSDTTDLGILTANFIDFNFTLHNISPIDTADMHAWLNLSDPFYLTSYPIGWYILPNSSGTFGMRINHLGVDTVYSVNVGFVASDVSDNFRDTLWHTFVVDMQVNSNTLLKPTDLIASDNGEDVLVTFNDPNVSDTTIAKDINFTLSSDINQFTYPIGSTLSYDVGKLKIAQASGSGAYYTWNRGEIQVNVVQGQKYYITVDAQKGTAKSVWLVMFNPAIVPVGSNLIANLSSTSNITFNYTYTATYSGVLTIQLQVNTDANSGQYGYFDNLLVKQTEPSYDSFVVERQSWYQNSQNGNFAVLKTITDGSLSFRDTVNDNTQWAYRVRFKKGEVYSDYSNSDTVLYTSPNVINPITADYYVGDETASGNWTTNSLENPMPFSTFYSGYSTNLVTINKKVYFIPGITIQFRFAPPMVDPIAWTFDGLPSGTTLFSDKNNPATFTSVDTLYQWRKAENWEYDGTNQLSATGVGVWKYRPSNHAYYTGTTLTSVNSQGSAHLALNGVYKPLYFNFNWSMESSPYTNQYQFVPSDSSYKKPSFDYPWSTRAWTETSIGAALYVYTGSSTVKPSSYYNSITITGGCEYLVKFDNCDNLTIDGLKFEGADYTTLQVEDCDNFTFKNNTGRKFAHRFMMLYRVNGFTAENNNINPGYDEWEGGRIYYEWYNYQGIFALRDGTNNVVIRNNDLINSTSGSFDVYAEANPANNIRVYNNNFGQSSKGLLPYYRPFQIANEMNDGIDNDGDGSGTDNDGTANPAYVPTNIFIYNNIIKNITISIKIAGKDVYIFNNVFEDCGVTRGQAWDHLIYKNPVSNQSIFNVEQMFLLRNSYTWQAHKWFFNNTFVNNNESFFNAINDGMVDKMYMHVVNNLFANQSITTANNYKGASDDGGIYSAYHLDFTIFYDIYDADGRGAWDVRNNYSYSDYTSSSSDKTVIYGSASASAPFAPRYLTWEELNSADSGGDIFSGNVTNYSSSLLSQVININSNYEPTSLIKSAGLNLNEIKTIYGANFTDRWGNQITDASGNFVGTMNIGANNKK